MSIGYIGGREAVLSTFIYLKCEFSMWKMSTKRGSNDPNLGQLLWTLGNYCSVYTQISVLRKRVNRIRVPFLSRRSHTICMWRCGEAIMDV